MTEIDKIEDPIIRDLLPGYLARRNEDLARLEDALQRADFEILRTTGHNLHGSGGAYGLPGLSRFGKQLEEAALAGDAAAAREIMDAMRSYLRGLVA